MNLVQCLYIENYVSPGGASETRSVEVAKIIYLFNFIANSIIIEISVSILLYKKYELLFIVK